MVIFHCYVSSPEGISIFERPATALKVHMKSHVAKWSSRDPALFSNSWRTQLHEPITCASPSKILCLCSWELYSNFKTNVLFMPETSRCWLNGTLSCLIGRSRWISALPEPKEQPFPQSQSIYRKLLASFTEGHSGRNKESRKKRARLARPQVEVNQITAEQSQLLLFRPGVTTQCQLDMGMAQDKEDKEDL